jgi:hypothetical protein
MCDGASESVLTEVLDRLAPRDSRLEFHEETPSRVCTTIVDDHDFVGNLLQAQFEVEMLNGCGNTAFFVPSRNYYGEQLERIAVDGRGGLHE